MLVVGWAIQRKLNEREGRQGDETKASKVWGSRMRNDENKRRCDRTQYAEKEI